MKKLFVLIAFVAAVSSASAQYDKANILGVRGGLNASMLTTNLGDGLDADRRAKFGWTVGVSDQILLSRQLPFYFEAGLYLNNKGGGYKYDRTVGSISESVNVMYGATYLQVPLKINYHVWAGAFTIEPYIGFHYNVALWGRGVVKGELKDSSNPENDRNRKETVDLYENRIFRRSDLGLMLGVGGSWSDLYFGLGWEAGFLNLSKADGGKAYNSSVFQVLVGYNF